MSKLYNMHSVYPLVQDLYGIDVDPDTFDDICLNGWLLINNKHTRLYRYIGDTVDGALELPCNVDVIESVHIPRLDVQLTGPMYDQISLENIMTERYIEVFNHEMNPYYQPGALISYKEGDNTLYFDHDYKHVMVVYHGIIADDEDGLPLINDKEMQALAAYIAYAWTFRDGIRRKDENTISVSQLLQAEWLKKCNAARIPDHISQNEMNDILDVKTRWDRKSYGKSYKVLR